MLKQQRFASAEEGIGKLSQRVADGTAPAPRRLVQVRPGIVRSGFVRKPTCFFEFLHRCQYGGVRKGGIGILIQFGQNILYGRAAPLPNDFQHPALLRAEEVEFLFVHFQNYRK